VEVARERFGLKDDPRLNIIVEDGRTYLNRTSAKYDAVLIDAFKSAASIPYHLTTRESMQHCYDVLTDDGVLVVNVIGSASGPGSEFVWAEVATLKTVFPQVELFLVQNVSIVASKSRTIDLGRAMDEASPGLARRRVDLKTMPDGTRVITDDFAPVDQYLMGI
jgi:spermidine synthase